MKYWIGFTAASIGWYLLFTAANLFLSEPFNWAILYGGILVGVGAILMSVDET